MCRPARMTLGRSSRWSIHRVSAGDPASRISSVPGLAVGEGLGLGGRVVDRAVGVEPDVAVGVDQAGQHPAAQRLDVGVRRGRALEGEPAADHPRLGTHVLGPDQDLTLQVQHRCHGADPRGPTLSERLPGCSACPARPPRGPSSSRASSRICAGTGHDAGHLLGRDPRPHGPLAGATARSRSQPVDVAEPHLEPEAHRSARP